MRKKKINKQNMNSVWKLIARPTSFLPVSHALLKNLKGSKCSQLIFSKFNGIVANSGCLVAGCCFSRQSDEATLLSNNSENSILVDIDTLNVETAGYLHSHCETPSYSVNMKRTVECVDETISPDVFLADDSNEISEPLQKKSKAVEASTQDECIQQKLCQNRNIPDQTESQPFGSAEALRRDRPPKQRPNYFVAVQILNPQIIQSLKDVHEHILKQEPRLKKSFTKLSTLHITLMVMYIGDPETRARAMKALQSFHLEHDDNMSQNPLHLQFQGLGHFQNKVIYAKLITDDAYQRLCSLEQSVKQHFAKASLLTTDTRDTFTPHLTVAKIDFKDKRKGLKKIDYSLYEDFSNQYFGSQRVESIQLLSMTDPKNDVGYYSGEEIYFSAFSPSCRMNSLKKMLGVEGQKKDVKEMINKLVKENLNNM